MSLFDKHPSQITDALVKRSLSGYREACDFASQIAEFVVKRTDTENLIRGFTLFRARNKSIELTGDDGTTFEPVDKSEIGVPPEHLTGLGRFNAPGNPALYLATTPEVALAECRALVDDVCSVATLQISKTCTVATLWGDVDAYESPETLFLNLLSNFLSRRVAGTEREDHYSSCNLISSALRECSIDGLAYRSSFWAPDWNGKNEDERLLGLNNSNVVLFDPSLAEVTGIETYRIAWQRPTAVRV